MKSCIRATTGILLCLLLLLNASFAGDLYQVEKKLWQPQPDKIYLQEVAQKIPTDQPVLSLAVYQGQCYGVLKGQIYVMQEDKLNQLKNAPSGVKQLFSIQDHLWAIAKDGLYRYNNSKWQKMDDREYVDLCMHLGVLHAATREDVYRLDNDKFISIQPPGGYLSSDITVTMADGTQILSDPVRIGPIDRIASYCGTINVLRPGQLVLFDGRIVENNIIDWGNLPSRNTRDLLSYGSRLFISTDHGLAVLRGAAMHTLKGQDGLPYEETTCLTKGFADDVWIGTGKGAVRMLENDWHYFAADHWLPGDNVHDIAVGDQIVYIATDKGVGIIRYEPYTLLKKAAYYERHIQEWGHKRLGFMHTLYKSGDQWIREISDNDGGHTAPYLAAMSYKYAVTGDETARQEALDAFKAMIWLERITPIDGFIARAIWSTTADRDQRSRFGSGGLPAKWYPTQDGKWYWKGDTSSDEIIAHYYAVSLFHDLVAEGREKEMAAEHMARIATHIIDNGWVLRDMDDKPTRWGRWDPDYLLRPYGSWDRGLNGLEAQAFIRATIAATGDQKYKDAFQQLIEWGYHNYTVRQKRTFPPGDVAPWDDNLAFEAYYTLFRFTDDPILRSIYLRSIARHWEVKRLEHSPWFNFTFGAVTGYDCDADRAVQHLREWTLECVDYSHQNSYRDDLYPEPGYVSYEGGIRAISPRETSAKRSSSNPRTYDGGAGGNRVRDPSGFLRDYWMGRYHGFIEGPETKDPDLISVKPHRNQKFGAKPYDGPARPELW